MSDDLRADITVYNPQAPIATPRLSQFAQSSLVFNHAYVQFALCGPSRNSFLSSRRPDTLASWNFLVSMRGDSRLVVSLPQAFKQAGYFTMSIGKVFHIYADIWDDSPTSWTATLLSPGPGDGDGGCTTPIMYCACQGQCADAQISSAAAAKLKALDSSTNPPPWFIAVGFRRPHPDFIVPDSFTANYQSATISAAKLLSAPNFATPSGMPTLAFYSCDNVIGRAPFTGSVQILPDGGVPVAAVQQVRRAYWTAGAYMDHQLGIVLDALAATQFQSNTIVAFTSDHGWNLGERGMWCKQANFETTTRVPLMVSVPWMSATHFGQRTDAVVELIDIMPTLLALANVSSADAQCIQGNDLTPLIANPNANAAAVADPFGGLLDATGTAPSSLPAAQQSWALSQYPRCQLTGANPWNNPCSQLGAGQFSYMGYTLRTARWRYTEWRVWLGLAADWSDAGLNSTELYDHQGDDGSDYDAFENLNVAWANPDVVSRLALALRLAALQGGYARECLPATIQTANPTPMPTEPPTPPTRAPVLPTRAPSVPSKAPSKARTLPPADTAAPTPDTAAPTSQPSSAPSRKPSTLPSAAPSALPTAAPTDPIATRKPTAALSDAPVAAPSASSPQQVCLGVKDTCSVQDWTCGALTTNNCGQELTCPCWELVAAVDGSSTARLALPVLLLLGAAVATCV